MTDFREDGTMPLSEGQKEDLRTRMEAVQAGALPYLLLHYRGDLTAENMYAVMAAIAYRQVVANKAEVTKH